MKNIRTNRIWQIVYPLILYYVMYNLIYIVSATLLAKYVSAVFCLMIAAIATIPAIYKIYRSLLIPKADPMIAVGDLPREGLYILGIVILGVLLNVGITYSGMMQWSSGYQQANATLYSGALVTKICANAIFIPLLEELLYRGIICGQLSLWYDRKAAIIISSIFFGIMHLNVIQFLYAFLMGLALSAVYLKTKKLWVTVVAHGMTNLVVILYTVLLA